MPLASPCGQSPSSFFVHACVTLFDCNLSGTLLTFDSYAWLFAFFFGSLVWFRGCSSCYPPIRSSLDRCTFHTISVRVHNDLHNTPFVLAMVRLSIQIRLHQKGGVFLPLLQQAATLVTRGSRGTSRNSGQVWRGVAKFQRTSEMEYPPKIALLMSVVAIQAGGKATFIRR